VPVVTPVLSRSTSSDSPPPRLIEFFLMSRLLPAWSLTGVLAFPLPPSAWECRRSAQFRGTLARRQCADGAGGAVARKVDAQIVSAGLPCRGYQRGQRAATDSIASVSASRLACVDRTVGLCGRFAYNGHRTRPHPPVVGIIMRTLVGST